MDDILRDTFTDMIGDEPPLATTADRATAAGHKLLRRRRARRAALAVGGVTFVTVLATAVPAVFAPSGGPGRLASAGSMASVSAGPSTTAPSTAAPQLRACPGLTAPARRWQNPAVKLPDAKRAEAAVLSAAPRIAPGLQFITRVRSSRHTSPKLAKPEVDLIFDVGDARGYGQLNVQIFGEFSNPPAQRAQIALSDITYNRRECVDYTRRDFPDGSVALSFLLSPNDTDLEHVWYYDVRGFTLIVAVFNSGWSNTIDPEKPVPPLLPARGEFPLQIDQTMEFAAIIAGAMA